MRMLDLFCGRGGWTRGFIACGFECDGYDIEPRFKDVYPGRFSQKDICTILPEDLCWGDYDFVCASPPCEEFSRHTMPWTRRKNPPEPSLELVNSAFMIADFLNAPLIPSWVNRRVKESYGSKERDKRAEIPYDLAYCVARWAGSLIEAERCCQ